MSYNARMIFPDELKDMSLDEIKKNRPDLREIAKAVSFALAYGGNGYTISNNLGIPPAEGDAIYDAYFAAFPGLLKHFERKIHESMTRGHIVIDEVTNRKFYFSDFGELNQYKKDRNWSAFYRLKGKYERACLNYCIQGAAGSITKLAGILFRQYILDNDYENEIMITNMVHDK